ncbi:MAG: hypothetical protein K6F50_03870 [Kiritimatiellae bacterium]|nr:hypothetical protein [Kiritimatiellia bacterium]
MFKTLHAKLGDFWWYSLMLFFACRAADVLNAAVGLWLVPKYVGSAELGAVMPLQAFAGFLALPVGIFAMTFMKEMTSLAANGEYGRMKSLMRGVFIGAGVFLALALVATKLVFPMFLERIRVAEGSLGFVILAAAFTGAVSPIYSNALQALKRFRTISFLNIVGAPVRFVAMLVAMPFRALTGYFVGQAATPAFSIAASVWSLRKELSAKAEPYWTRPVVKRFSALLAAIALSQYAGSMLGLVEQTVLRQRLPEIDSAAYYMATRFSDIAGYVTCTLSTILFPFTASLAAEGKSTRPLVVKSILATLAASAALAIGFAFAGESILRLLPEGDKYAPFAWSIPWLIILQALGAIQVFHLNTEVSAGRFAFLKWWVPMHVAFAAALLLVTGYGYFTACIPQSWSAFLARNNFTSLKAMLVWFTATSAVKTAVCLCELWRQRR